MINSLIKSLKQQTAVWFIGVVITIMGVFSSHITESIKFSLNRADLRSTQYEKIANDISNFIFWSQVFDKFTRNNWMTRKNYEYINKEYNQSLINLKKKEFVYIAWIGKFWGKKEIEDFEILMGLIQQFDDECTKFNYKFDEFDLNTKQKNVNTINFDPKVFASMQRIINQMRLQSSNLLLKLAK